MRVMVQKYGGSSVSDLDKLRGVAARVVRAREAGWAVVVVVSAMGNTTNELLALARQLSDDPDRRELDMLVSVGERISMALLAMAIRDAGAPAVSLTGSQSGILTDGRHADARVVAVRPDRIRAALDRDEVVVVAGFQGVSLDREVTTLGRGGSDTTAVVLAAALGAEVCELCSDVDGIWSADPRVVPAAHRLDVLGLDEALALARSGARVLYEDAVRYARDHGVELQASATFGPGAGTRITLDAPARRGAVAVATDVLHRLRPLRDDVARVEAAGGRARRVVGREVWFDVRNVHGALPPLAGEALGAVGLVSAVGSGLGERAADVLGLADRLGSAHFGAAGDVAWWSSDEPERDAGVVHAALIGGDDHASA